MPVFRYVLTGLACFLVAGCAALGDPPPFYYQCPHDLRFTAHLYQDKATLDGMRGHAVLTRVAANADTGTSVRGKTAAASLRYVDDSVRAEFGLGVGGRLVRLDYADIPDPVYCVRIAKPGASMVRPYAASEDAPRPPPPPPDPNAPGQTNLRTSDGQPVHVN